MINSKSSKTHNSPHQKSNANNKSKQSSSLKSRDSGLSPEPRYEKHYTESECVDYGTHSLGNDITDLKSRLQKEEAEKEQLKLQIQHLFEEKNITQKHLDAINQAYEMRITEMRCVIVELKNRLKSQQSCAIMEESEAEESDLSFQEGSVYNSEAETNSCNDPPKVNEQQKSKVKDMPYLPPSSENILQIQSLQEEVLTLRSQIALLQSEIATRDQYYEKGSNPESHQYHEDSHPQIFNEETQVVEEEEENVMKNLPVIHKNIPLEVVPIMKVAERVKLKQIMEDNVASQCLPSSDNDDTIEELSEQLKTHFDSEMNPKNVHKELKQLYRRIEQLKFQNSVLTLNLAENKQHCNYLYLLCGKYESNAIALQQALNCSDRAIEAYDVMLALLESKLAMLENIECAEENRNTAESVAHLLLNRLKKENSIYGKSSAPWQDGVVLQSDVENEPWTEEHDLMLRSQVSKLKGQRSLIQNTVVNLESPFCANAAANSNTDTIDKNPSQQRNKNIEMAMMMQEIANLREEICELKLQQSEDVDVGGFVGGRRSEAQ